MNRLKLRYPIFVEGSYDKSRVAAVADTMIIVGGGFGVFNARETLALLKRITEDGKLIMLTDSDDAGRLIRNKLKGVLKAENLINLYIPQIKGKEKRKAVPSKAGLLGVEAMGDEVLRKLLLPYAVDSAQSAENEPVSTADLYGAGLSGCGDSAFMRKDFCSKAGLPLNLSPKALKEAINLLGGKKFFFEILELLK